MVSANTTTLRAGFIGSVPLRGRLLDIANPRGVGKLQNRLSISHVNWNTASITRYIDSQPRPDAFIVDCSNSAAAKQQLDQIASLALNGAPFLGVTSIDQGETPNPLSDLYRLTARFSAIGADMGSRFVPLLSDIVEISSLEQMAGTDPVGAHNVLFGSIFKAMELCQSRHNSLTDNLTGLPSDRAFSLLLSESLKLASREENENTALVFADLRGFKAINDTHGHVLADQVLKRFAEIFRDGIRESDVVARPHGDEFYFLFPRTTEEAVKRIVENILAKVTAETSPFADIHPDLKPGVNLGALVFSVGNRDQKETLYRLARQYFESMGKPFEADMLGNFLIDIADKLSYLSRTRGENRLNIGHTKDIPDIQSSFADITANGRQR